MPPETEILVDSFVSGSFWPTLTDRIKLAAIGESRNSAWHGSGFERRSLARYRGARFLLESAEKEVPGTSVRLGTPAIMGGKTALQSTELLPLLMPPRLVRSGVTERRRLFLFCIPQVTGFPVDYQLVQSVVMLDARENA